MHDYFQKRVCLGVIIFMMPLFAAAGEAQYPVAFPDASRTPQKKEEQPDVSAKTPFLKKETDSHPGVKTERPPDSAAWLLRRLHESEDPANRARASEAWPISDATMADMNALMPALLDSAPEVRAAALRRIESHTPYEVFGYVMQTMTQGNAASVHAVNEALPHLESMLGPLMAETLRTELETLPHRRIAAYCLGRMGSAIHADLLAEQAWNKEVELDRACVNALYGILAPQSLPHWFSILEHPDYHCRATAVRALAVIGGSAAFDQLCALILHEGETALQTEALQAVADYPEAQLFPLLVESLERNPDTRPLALHQLRTRAGVDFGADLPSWRRWLEEYMAPPPPPPIIPSQ